MQLGLSTYSFPWAFGVAGYDPETKMSVADLIGFASEKGVKHVQIGDNYPLHKLNDAELGLISTHSVTARVSVQVGMRKLAVEPVLDYLKICSELRSPFLRIVIDDRNYHPSENEVVAVIRELLPELKRHNILLAIENHDRFPSPTLERIIKNTDQKYVGICLDTANSFGAVEGTYETVKLLAPYAVNLHIKDVIINRLEHKMGFVIEGTAAGSGLLNIPWIINEVEKYQKCETATLEVWSGFEGSISDTVAREKQMVNDSLQYLKRIIK